MKRMVAAMAASAAAGLFFAAAAPACSSSACSYQASACSADPKLTSDQIAEHDAKCADSEKTATCVSENAALVSCQRSNQKCLDDKTDELQTAVAVAANCRVQIELYNRCKAGTK